MTRFIPTWTRERCTGLVVLEVLVSREARTRDVKSGRERDALCLVHLILITLVAVVNKSMAVSLLPAATTRTRYRIPRSDLARVAFVRDRFPVSLRDMRRSSTSFPAKQASLPVRNLFCYNFSRDPRISRSGGLMNQRVQETRKAPKACGTLRNIARMATPGILAQTARFFGSGSLFRHLVSR